ncbi:MAG: F0F1 ATP synthase subunit B [Rhodospirillaceae bacterium]|nr:F0F1 ATP synthase subunit B [Rhodospirillaceae bacterium]
MFISRALAAETAANHAEPLNYAEPFYASTSFIVAAAFVMFFVFFGKKIFIALGSMLDDRSDKIRNELDEARRLREEAQDVLAEYERKQHDAMEEAENIVAAAREEAERLGLEASKQLDASIKRAEQMAKDRIDQAEAQAVAEVRAIVVDVAIEATGKILEKDISGAKAKEIINNSISEIGKKLN